MSLTEQRNAMEVALQVYREAAADKTCAKDAYGVAAHIYSELTGLSFLRATQHLREAIESNQADGVFPGTAHP